ncbi:hypothetical protein C8Q75DRAFT_322050 [Abortiporus biennis]|nr:hypothetical protein C8Q75DRAFT_322050 [Abortiporus biennis]
MYSRNILFCNSSIHYTDYYDSYHSRSTGYCPPTSSIPATTTSTGATPTGTQIRADQDPVYHFYLQENAGQLMLGPESSSGYFTISGGTITLNNSNGTNLFINVQESASTSFKPLTLDTTATTTDWGLEGDTIITTAPRQLNFLTCSSTTTEGYWDVYLQEGSDVPSGQTCTNYITLHLPCLC